MLTILTLVTTNSRPNNTISDLQ